MFTIDAKVKTFLEFKNKVFLKKKNKQLNKYKIYI